jgi:hypothetical protein
MLIDKIITWGDDSTTHIVVDDYGYYHIDGVRRKLVTMDASLATRNAGVYTDANNLARLSQEFAYLASKGMKLIRMGVGYGSNSDVANMHAVLDLAYDNKLMVIPTMTYKYDNIDNLTTIDFTLSGGGTVSTHFNNYLDAIITYPHVIGLAFDNELDDRSTGGGHTYLADDVLAYESFLIGLAQAKTSLPIECKTMARRTDTSEAQYIQEHLATLTKIDAVNMYQDSAAEFTSICTAQRTFNATYGRPQTFHVTEWGLHTALDPTATTIAEIDATFAGGATEVCLWAMEYSDSKGYFSGNAGTATPIANLDTLMANMTTWQAAI